ncbi:MAG: hypothetical protein M1839_004498 [Geoglossum umbratile]|nr:MAG: hypothetical protein M1839_004498 [Geoglossum umbratile]
MDSTVLQHGRTCSLCKKWLDTVPHSMSSFVLVDDLYPSTASNNNDVLLSALLASAKGGCVGCQLLSTGSLVYARSLGREEDLEAIRFTDTASLLSAKLLWKGETLPEEITDRVDESRFEFYAHWSERSLLPTLAKASLIPLSGIGDATKPWESFKGIQPAEHLHTDVTSSDRLMLIRVWLKVCEKLHEGPCVTKYDHPLPTRVLDVGVPGQPHIINLFESKGKVGRYIALSHCWGKTPIIKTLSTTLETFKSGMPVESLPKTFQEAILLTRRLGIQYLWIDSLCIIQDDEADWEREASQMASVYGNSYLTIAASSASDSTVGCFIQRTVRPCQSYKVKDCVPSEDGNYTEVFVRQRLRQLCGLEWFVGKRINVKTDRPLETRAWTYQEDILPRRILKLYSDEIIFECEQQTVRESLFERTNNSRGLRIANSNATPEVISDQWRSHVIQYSGRSFTYVKDRLPALSGIAYEFHKLNQSTYCAGLWKHSIQEDLQWHTETETPLTRLESTEGNALPTWSWA